VDEWARLLMDTYNHLKEESVFTPADNAASADERATIME
jgi:hypothetical protein